MVVPENVESVQRAGVRSYSTRRLAIFAAPFGFGFGFVLIAVVERVASRLIADVLGVPLLAVLLAGLLLVVVLIVVAVVVVRRLPPLLVDVNRLELVDGARRYPASSIIAAREQTQTSRVPALSTPERLITITLESPRGRMSAAQREALAAFLAATAIREPMAAAAIDRQYDPQGRFAHVTGNGDLDRDAAVAYVRHTRVQRDEHDADAL